MIWTPEDQQILADLMAQDPSTAEKIVRKQARGMASQHFGIVNAPQTAQQVSEILPTMMGTFIDFATVPVPPGRVLQMQHAARAAFFDRLRSLVALSEMEGGHAQQ